MTTLVRLPIEILSQITQDLLDENRFKAITNLANSCHGLRNFILGELARRLQNSFRDGSSYVEARQHGLSVRVSPPIFNHVDEEFTFSGEYPLDPVYCYGFRVGIVFENIHYILSSRQVPALNIRHADQLFRDYDCLVEMRGGGGAIPGIFRRRMYIWTRFSGTGANSTLELVRFKFKDVFNFVDSV